MAFKKAKSFDFGDQRNNYIEKYINDLLPFMSDYGSFSISSVIYSSDFNDEDKSKALDLSIDIRTVMRDQMFYIRNHHDLGSDVLLTDRGREAKKNAIKMKSKLDVPDDSFYQNEESKRKIARSIWSEFLLLCPDYDDFRIEDIIKEYISKNNIQDEREITELHTNLVNILDTKGFIANSQFGVMCIILKEPAIKIKPNILKHRILKCVCERTAAGVKTNREKLSTETNIPAEDLDWMTAQMASRDEGTIMRVDDIISASKKYTVHTNDYSVAKLKTEFYLNIQTYSTMTIDNSKHATASDGGVASIESEVKNNNIKINKEDPEIKTLAKQSIGLSKKQVFWTIVGLIITVATGLYIAYRQGAFS
ncbi:MAG: hypothetical protein QM737_17715 [Ferruginibacter sp.]